MKEYSPKRRTALVLAGSGTSGAYHAGALRALDEAGIKIDVIVGSGAGAVAAAFGAVAGGQRLYGDGGFWDGLGWRGLYRLDPALRICGLLLGCALAVFLLPVLLALVAGLLFPVLLIADMVAPGRPAQLLQMLALAPAALRVPYLAALAVPVFVFCVLLLGFLARYWLRDRRRFAQRFEALFDARAGRERLSRALWEVARGPALSDDAPAEPDLGQRYVAVATENFGQPGFRELVLRTADLETGGVVPFVLLDDKHRAAFAAAQGRGLRSRLDGLPGAVDLRAPGYDVLLFDAVLTGLLPPVVAPVHRVTFPRGGLFAGETHRLAEATLAAGSGISEALAAGAEQVVLVTAVPEQAGPPPRRRGPRALLDGVLSTLERQAVDLEIRNAERINRMVETLGHDTPDGGRAWQDPATGRLYRSFGLYVVRPERRALGPLELDGALHPATEVLETPRDLLAQGYRDAYREFVEPVVGAVPEPQAVKAPEEAPRSVEL